MPITYIEDSCRQEQHYKRTIFEVTLTDCSFPPTVQRGNENI
jgi:hypothetical protein